MRYIAAILFMLTALKSHACFILVARDDKHTLVANHEDWIQRDAAIRVIGPDKGRFGSVIFTFVSEGWAQGGMNEKGLFFDAARTPFQEINFDPASRIYEGYIWQMVLERASTVDEAVQLLEQFRLSELIESTIMLADATGQAVLIGAHNHKVEVRPISGSTLMQTNFNQWQPELSDGQVCKRFQTAQQHLGHSSVVSVDNLLSILKKTHQDSLTVYSNIYDLTNRTIYTYTKARFDQPIIVTLPDIFSRRDCMLELDSLVAHQNYWDKCSASDKSLIRLNGKLTDERGAAVAYANIGIPGKNIGTLSDPDGSFTLDVPKNLMRDSIRFSSIGYECKLIALNTLSNRGRVELKSQATVLDELTIKGKSLHSKISRLGWMGGRDGVLPLDTIQGGGAVALLLESQGVPLFVDKLQVRLMYNSKDTLALRLHFFAYDSLLDIPGEELLGEEIMLKENKKFGWLRFDLSKYQIFINQKKFFVAFEWIDDQQTRTKMINSLKEWERWKQDQYQKGNKKVEFIPASGEVPYASYKYHGNMMDWPGFKILPPFTGLMIETGKTNETVRLRTFERKTSFGDWREIPSTLNAVVTVRY